MSQTVTGHSDLDRQCLRQFRQLGLELRHFFDIGASNGCWSNSVSEDFPDATFDLFEPLIDHAAAYQEIMDWVLARHPRFRLHKVALGAEHARAKMCLYPDNLVGSTALDLGGVPNGAKLIDVEMLTIDHAVQVLKLPVPQVIKIDTQGCELSVLQGAQQTLPQVEVLLLECWLVRAYGKSNPLLLEVANWLRDFNFHLWDFSDACRDEEGTLISRDCFFLNARCKVSRLNEEPVRHPNQLGNIPGRHHLNQSETTRLLQH
jgi:FkbM family methyltransferase